MKKLLKKIKSKYYNLVFAPYSTELEKLIENSETILDVGCGANSPIQHFRKKIYSVGIDVFEPALSVSRIKKIHNEYYQMNVLDIDKEFPENFFDCVLASDLIEHLTKKEGLELIQKMEKIAKKKIIIFTPNGYLPQGECENNPYQEHKSGWTSEEMKQKGYEVIGINGWKKLRGFKAEVVYSPNIMWNFISDITQFFVKRRPKYAFQILCVKKKY